MARWWRAVGTALLLMNGGHARPAAQAPSERQAFTSTATAILVDVVVRDAKNHPVTDLRGQDFEISEDGLSQKIDSFSRVSHGGGIGVGVAWKSSGDTVTVAPAAEGAATPPAPAEVDDSTTALVFDHLSSESLRLAQRATLEYVPNTGEAGVRVGVFATDPGIRVVQSYTTDRTLIRRAVQQIVPSGMAVEEQKEQRTDELISRRRQLEAQAQSAGAGQIAGTGAAMARNASEIGERENELRQLQTELNMIRSFDKLDRDHRGYDTALTLLSVVQSLSFLPGRKTVVFFSEGLPVSPALAARLDYVIDAANRANVTAYAVDAKGLRSKSALTATQKEIDTFAEERMTQITTGTNRTEQPLTMAFERVEDTLKLDSRTGLARLSSETGGFLVEGSNDLSSAFRRIDEDNQFHYLLTYAPRSPSADGKFHAIQVRVRRPGVHVFARKGYRALGAPRSIDAGAYEVPALALLDRTPLPNAFPVHAAAFSFPETAREGLTPVLVHVRTNALHFTTDRNRSTYSAQAAIVVRLRDGGGHEVLKLSQQYLLSGESKDLDAARQGDILFYREADLPSGVYTMEAIVYDATGRQGSARVSTLTVPAAGSSSIHMSSLVLVNKAEEIKDSRAIDSDAAGPLYVGQTLLYPNLGEPITKSNTSELPFYFALYGDVSGARAVAQLLRNGRAVAEAPVELPPATASRVQQVSRLPIATLPVGTYELRIRVMHKGEELSRSAFFTLQD
jgi:VWFA-related protein